MNVTEIKKIFHPVELIEIHGTPPAEELSNSLGPYHELSNQRDVILAWINGLGLLIFLMYLIYHMISKIRGNEKNVQLNNYGIGLSLLGLISYSIVFIDYCTDTLAHETRVRWIRKHQTLYRSIISSSNSVSLLYHWLFNWRYVKSTFRLPVLK